MNINFKGQVVLVTGATRGIGKRIADDFYASGAKLILTGTHKTQIESLNRSAKRNRKSRKTYHCVDFTDAASTRDFIRGLGKLKKIDVCVNNAGINAIDYIHEARVEDWNDIMAVNLKAPFLITREISKIMKKNRYGRIINIASVYGTKSREKRSVYSASKFGIKGLTVSVSNELARYNVLVNTVSPGFVLTELTRRILSKREIRELISRIPEKRFAAPEEISRVILFLSSPLNTYLTGQDIVVDGGYVNV